ncbi:hypothetical protein B6U70_01940 [Euryarchaeota archaeon ex4484_162]|nr:MAG: hypothetical protein B6U70_01940 [Euryarchaeota archaeon ex4484_162]RLF29253.1 MAG: hypothetical protein DRN05_02065 [Thermoplasmata archaeon]
MKYAVVGLGAVGSIIGGFIAQTGENIVLIGKKNQIERIKKYGIKIDDVEIKKNNMILTERFSYLSDVDVVFVCVKSQDTENVARSINKHLKDKALIVSLQNGVRNASILEKITGVKTLSGIILFNAVYNKAGDVSLTMRGGILLEYNRDRKDMIIEIHKLLKKAGFRVKLIEDINAALWSKLVLNLQIAVTALTGQTIKESIGNKTSRELIIATIEEGIQITRGSGIKLSALPYVDPNRMIWVLKTFGFLSPIISSYVLGLKKEARNSMWQSLSRGKSTEIDYINGEIVKLAKQNGLQAPINTKLVELIKEVEKEHSMKRFEPYELKKILKNG